MNKDGDISTYYENQPQANEPGHKKHQDLSEGVGLDHLAGIHDAALIDDDRVRVNILYCIGWQYKGTYA